MAVKVKVKNAVSLQSIPLLHSQTALGHPPANVECYINSNVLAAAPQVGALMLPLEAAAAAAASSEQSLVLKDITSCP